MMRQVSFLLFLGFLCSGAIGMALPNRAEAALSLETGALPPTLPSGLFEAGEGVRVSAVVDGLTLILDDGRTLRLAGIEAPAFEGADAASALRDSLQGKTIRLHYGPVRHDRWRRVLAHVTVDVPAGGSGAPVWVQGDLLARGLVRVQTTPDNPGGARAMYTLENGARSAGRGLWADSRFAVRTLPLDDGDLRAVQVVEGQIASANKVRGQIYLNFGDDWDTDFTVLLPHAVRRQMEQTGLTVETLGGATVRVRGWVKEWNGPMIELTHLEQLEILNMPFTYGNQTGEAGRGETEGIEKGRPG